MVAPPLSSEAIKATFTEFAPTREAAPIVGAVGTVGERVRIAREVADGIDGPTEFVANTRNL